MPYSRIVVTLTAEERSALLEIADLECRDAGEQLRFLLRQEAQRRGLLCQADTVKDASLRQTGDVGPSITTHKR